ncbi:hypothetical protein Ade02nite_91820 [Paractinoplanes deccanensis]|uniref:Uncharacterized protein n=1 Tax=Paractinoplanes deccanensis TaxID=113561 RepID=A0ABQ3YKK5_9ACTN|nr:hypothetical protein Ade02nite_91820 [Actinoplanes deccanensis]
MAKDHDEQFTPDRNWRVQISAWKTSALVWHEVGGSILVDKWTAGKWLKTPEATIHLQVYLVGLTPDRVFLVHEHTADRAGYRDWREKSWGLVITFGVVDFGQPIGPGASLPVGGINLPSSRESVRGVRARGDVVIPGYSRIVFPEVCSGDFCK